MLSTNYFAFYMLQNTLSSISCVKQRETLCVSPDECLKMILVNIVLQPPTMERLLTHLRPEGGIKTGMCNSNIKNEAPRLQCTCLLENTSTSVEETGTAERGGRVSHVQNYVCVIDIEKHMKVTSQKNSSFFFFF